MQAQARSSAALRHRVSPIVHSVRLPVALPNARVYGKAATRLVTRVAAIEEQTSYEVPGDGQEAVVNEQPQKVFPEVTAEEGEQLELEQLDQAQEQLLKWMLFNDEETQEEDLDEMVDYDEFGDGEYEELYEELESLYDAYEGDLKIGDTVVGTVYEVDEDGAYVEIGKKASGFVPLSECSFAKLKSPLEVLRVGMKREFTVVEQEDETYGQVVLSLATSEATVFWQRTRQMQEEDITVMVKVESANKGGLLVKYGPYDGFVPVSQFGAQITLENMETLVGNDIPVKFLEVDEEKERLVLSNKRASVAGSGDMQSFKVGDVVLGTVQSIKPYGAFIDLGNGATGLLHVSQISHDRITNVEKVLHLDDKLKVMVLSMDKDRNRVTLSTKKLEPTPGDMLRDPQLVYEKAEEMAIQFRQRVEAAEQSARNQDAGAPGPAGDYVF